MTLVCGSSQAIDPGPSGQGSLVEPLNIPKEPWFFVGDVCTMIYNGLQIFGMGVFYFCWNYIG